VEVRFTVVLGGIPPVWRSWHRKGSAISSTDSRNAKSSAGSGNGAWPVPVAPVQRVRPAREPTGSTP
jgi:hypothetical protein